MKPYEFNEALGPSSKIGTPFQPGSRCWFQPRKGVWRVGKVEDTDGPERLISYTVNGGRTYLHAVKLTRELKEVPANVVEATPGDKIPAPVGVQYKDCQEFRDYMACDGNTGQGHIFRFICSLSDACGVKATTVGWQEGDPLEYKDEQPYTLLYRADLSSPVVRQLIKRVHAWAYSPEQP